jgi:hypothetical protein
MENLIVVLMALAVAALAIWQYYAAQKRRQGLQQWAESQGLTFDPGRDRGFDERFPAFGCLRQGSNRYAYNLMAGRWRDYAFLGFDYHYETYSHDSKGRRQTHHHRFSAVVLGSPVPLKPLFIRPEGFFDRITEFLGFDDIDFESIEFSRAFYVKSPEKRWAYNVLHPRTMDFLLKSPRFTLQFDEGCAIAYRSSQFALHEFEAAAEVLRGILERLPRYLAEESRREESRQGGEGTP